MKRYIARARNNPLISGSIVIFIGSNFANVFSFLYNLFITRNLSGVDLGVLLSLISIITLFTLPAGSLIPTIVNFAATFFAQGELGKLRGLFLQFGKISSLLGLIIFICSLLFASQVATFLNIDNPRLIMISGFAILIGYMGITNLAFLQAKLAFTFISLSNLIGAITKFVFSVIFILLGYGVQGAIWGFLLASVIPYLLSFHQLRFVIDRNIALSKSKINELFTYGTPATVALFSLTSFISTDVILVKHFFSPQEAGNYAVLSVVGRIIYYLTAPISTVMFPMVVQKYTRGEKFDNIFKIALLLVLIPSIFLTLIYFLFPDLIIKIIVNKQYSQHLGLFGLFITAYALLQVLTNFYLSIQRTKVFIPILIGAILQSILIVLFHNTLLDIILISLGIVFVLLIGLLLYYPYATKR